jgi:U3 small nucleolar RNA-associated protein 3
MGKRRNTAKTGDKAIYKARDAYERKSNSSSRHDINDDPMNDEVDRFHNDREMEFLRLDEGISSGSDNEEDRVEAVMDLAAGGDSSDDDDNDSTDDENDEAGDLDDDDDDKAESSSEENEISSSEDEIAENEENNVRAWGSKKSSYHHGDSADIDDDDEDDAELEEKAAKEVQASRYKEMTEEDFILSDADDDENDENHQHDSTVGNQEKTTISSTKDITKLSIKEKRKIIDKQHPEMLPLVSHFSSVVEDLSNQTSVATRAIFETEGNNGEVSSLFVVISLFVCFIVLVVNSWHWILIH